MERALECEPEGGRLSASTIRISERGEPLSQIREEGQIVKDSSVEWGEVGRTPDSRRFGGGNDG